MTTQPLFPLPTKRFVRTPEDAIPLPDHLLKLMNVLLQLRREAREPGQTREPDVISPSSRLIASRCRLSLGQTKRNLGDLALAYPDILFEYPHKTLRVIRFAFNLAGPDTEATRDDRTFTATPTKPRRARRADPTPDLDAPAATVQMSTVAPDMPTLDAPVIPTDVNFDAPGAPSLLYESFKREEEREDNVTLPAAAPPEDGGTTPTATVDALAEHLDRMPLAERSEIEKTVRSSHPRASGIRLVGLVATEVLRLRPDLAPKDDVVTPPPPPARPASVRVYRSELERLLFMADPASPESVDLLTAELVRELNDPGSIPWIAGVSAEVARKALPADLVYQAAVDAKRRAVRDGPRPGQVFNTTVKGLRKLGVSTIGKGGARP